MDHTIYVFDAYGTLFDVHSAVRKQASVIGPDAETLSNLWRQKQLEYSWVHALMGQYIDFWQLTEAALDFAFDSVESADPDLRSLLLDAYKTLDCYNEVPLVLEQLASQGAKLAILSNGSPQMLNAAVDAANIGHLLDEVLSVDELKTFKTSQSVYDMVTTRFKVFADTVSFQSSNRWDIAGATAFGFRTVWINRTGAPDEYKSFPPAAELSSLTDLPLLT